MSEPIHSLPPSRSATLGGVGAIFVTGVFAIVAAGAVLVMAAGYGFRMEAIDWVLLGFVLVLTLGGGVALARFIRRNPGAIGEARFDTMGGPAADTGLRRRNAMVEARWNGTLIASSDDTIVVEGNHYFPADAVDPALLRPSPTTSICPWKGTAHYHSLHIAGADNRDAVWYYPDPKPKAENIRGRFAFWKGVEVG